jgi:hypothetical protein
MTNLQILKSDLEMHVARREQLANGNGGFFIRREGYPVTGVLASYDKIIVSLKKEIADLEIKKTARKQPQKKTTTKKKTSSKKKAAK